MITYKELRWGSAFSYGPNNTLKLNDTQLTQIVGKNGNGKSSIALLLEEIQFNTNSKKIKKTNVLNRYTDSKNYYIELDFEKDNVPYTISTTRTNTTATVRLMSGNTDLSGHTATTTYKTIETLLGYDFKTFGQIVYQSSAASLEFLTATDTARKAFLIDLLNLSAYPTAAEVFKDLAKNVGYTVSTLSTKIETINGWLAAHAKEDLTTRTLVVEPEFPSDLTSKLSALEVSLTNIASTNKKISTNNTYKTILDGIVLTGVPSPSTNEQNVVNLRVQLAEYEKKLVNEHASIKECSRSSSTCPTCKQPVDNSFAVNRAKEASENVDLLIHGIKDLESLINAYDLANKVYQAGQKQLSEWEKYHALFDTNLSNELLVETDITTEIGNLKAAIKQATQAIESAKKLNAAVVAHNTKVIVISNQIANMRSDLEEYSVKLVEASEDLSKLQVLVKAFSSTGLVAYKIESLVKDLEKLTNEYLADMADGRFQLSFKIASADKLNVVITDNGQDIDIVALSTGERARVNISTLLAIRKLMQSLSNSRTNLLILDETIENLDADGKEKLVELLLRESDLNTILISHSFSHPLIDRIHVIKENNISRIE